MITVYPFKLNGNGKYDNDKYATLAGEIYLHGLIAEENGYDMCGLKELPEEDGIYDSEVLTDDGIRQAKLFYWTTQLVAYGRSFTHRRGLVVQLDDGENMMTAREEFAARSAFL